MTFRNSSLNEIKKIVKECLNQLYCIDDDILKRNEGKGVCERAIVFRFAHYLQNKVQDAYFVDCDFNSSFMDKRGKPIVNKDNTVTKRFIDIIVHNRNSDTANDLICFEIKKWNNTNSKEIEKDKNNLHFLTEHEYAYGFHLTIHKKKMKSKWTIFKDGNPIVLDALIFENNNTI